MLCAFLRVVQRVEKLPGTLGKQLLPHSVLSRACLRTQPLRWGLLEQKKRVHPRTVLGFTQKTFWTHGPEPQKAKEDSSKQVSVHRNQRGEAAVSTSQKVKEAGRDFTYLIVVLVGVSVTGGLLYTIFKELFSSSSPNIIYGKALEKCRTHPEVISVFGEPVKGYGEMTRRGRRQHVSFIEYAKNELKRIRVKFYIEGSEPGKQGTVHAEVEADPQSGQFEFRYVFVEVAPARSIVVEDNRSQKS
ncbi:mitochondrial import inner membrane translocase subunit Tim21 [Phodopus roborovskii]|uniref:Mitochondrial import inner membrane translocase subunit Tim21 n=1 Tax=Phodopus roborovskii TaxID=109678 RepID=A0AAV0A204_PHORO|nr:mitochondrial import inner membrane translocase subunit Tim21 [Phodopus roborovskii]CAH7083672.1 Timm21 [Phodopus roborovskii]